MTAAEHRVYTLCGSTRFPDAFALANMHLSALGHIVGSSTKREIAYARSQCKAVEWMFPDAIPAGLEVAA